MFSVGLNLLVLEAFEKNISNLILVKKDKMIRKLRSITCKKVEPVLSAVFTCVRFQPLLAWSRAALSWSFFASCFSFTPISFFVFIFLQLFLSLFLAPPMFGAFLLLELWAVCDLKQGEDRRYLQHWHSCSYTVVWASGNHLLVWQQALWQMKAANICSALQTVRPLAAL